MGVVWYKAGIEETGGIVMPQEYVMVENGKGVNWNVKYE